MLLRIFSAHHDHGLRILLRDLRQILPFLLSLCRPHVLQLQPGPGGCRSCLWWLLLPPGPRPSLPNSSALERSSACQAGS